MAVTALKGFDTLGPNDITVRQKAERAAVIDPTDTYKHDTVHAEFGDKTKAVVLKFPDGGTFVFAVYADNPEWHKLSRDTWHAGAADALEKFCATRGLTAVSPPREEITNRYNLWVEVRENVR